MLNLPCTDVNKIMDLVKKRFPQAQLAPYTSEEAMISGIKSWRRSYTDTLKDFFEENTDADDILRSDTCINGYGIVECSELSHIVLVSYLSCICLYQETAEIQQLMYIVSLNY